MGAGRHLLLVHRTRRRHRVYLFQECPLAQLREPLFFFVVDRKSLRLNHRLQRLDVLSTLEDLLAQLADGDELLLDCLLEGDGAAHAVH